MININTANMNTASMNTAEIMTVAIDLLAQQEFKERYPNHRHAAQNDGPEPHLLQQLCEAGRFDNFERACKVAIRSYCRIADNRLIDEMYKNRFEVLRSASAKYA